MSACPCIVGLTQRWLGFGNGQSVNFVLLGLWSCSPTPGSLWRTLQLLSRRAFLPVELEHAGQRRSPPSLRGNVDADLCVSLLPAQSCVHAVGTRLPPGSPVTVPHGRPASLSSPAPSVGHWQQGGLVEPRRPVLWPGRGSMGLARTLSAVRRLSEDGDTVHWGAEGAGAHSAGGETVHRYVQQRTEGPRWRQVTRLLARQPQLLQLFQQLMSLQGTRDRLEVETTPVVWIVKQEGQF